VSILSFDNVDVHDDDSSRDYGFVTEIGFGLEFGWRRSSLFLFLSLFLYLSPQNRHPFSPYLASYAVRPRRANSIDIMI